jgi:hypothetical protein
MRHTIVIAEPVKRHASGEVSEGDGELEARLKSLPTHGVCLGEPGVNLSNSSWNMAGSMRRKF